MKNQNTIQRLKSTIRSEAKAQQQPLRQLQRIKNMDANTVALPNEMQGPAGKIHLNKVENDGRDDIL